MTLIRISQIICLKVLLDVNMGQKILLRLRPARAPDTFYEEEDIIGTMLHEVCV